ncbi:MAG: hydrogenase nickel incorporation protein HypB [Magnetococcus sp. YQC-5]
MAHNDAFAAQNRHWLSQRGVFAINLISSPGSGKTLLLERTLDQIKGTIPCAVIVGDVHTDHDARRLVGKGARVHQIETIHSCHLNAEQIGKVLPDLVQDGIKLLIIENVGNLVCPAAFDLGEHCKVALLSVTEGEDKPLKYPLLFSVAPVCLLTKIDLIPHLAWNENLCCANLRKIRPDAEILKISAMDGNGMDAWLHFLEYHALRAKSQKQNLGG